ncbi:MAG: NAD(P)H-binding protein [Dietzia sp.]
MSIDRPVTIIGGHGKIARRAARILSEAGAEVYSVIRNPDQADDIRETGATPVVADVEKLDVDGLREVLRGSGSVVWAAGAGGGSADRTFAVDRDAAIRSMDASVQEGIERYVMISYDGARPDHGVPEDDSFYPYAQAKAAADAHLRDSELQWTILGPGMLTDEPGGESIGVGADKRDDRATSRDVVAAVVAAVLRRPDTVGRTIEFSDGQTPIGEALTRE